MNDTIREIFFDPETDKWFNQHPGECSTVAKCELCNIYYKPELGHKCKCEVVSTLEPCPFCGSPAELRETHRFPSCFNYTPRCTVTSCAGRLTKLWMDKAAAIEAWNRRVDDGQRSDKG